MATNKKKQENDMSVEDYLAALKDGNSDLNGQQEQVVTPPMVQVLPTVQATVPDPLTTTPLMTEEEKARARDALVRQLRPVADAIGVPLDNLLYGYMSRAEGIGDALANITGIFGNDDYKRKLQDFVAVDSTKDMFGGVPEAPFKSQFLQGVIQSIGGMGFDAIANMIALGAGLASLGVGAAGKSTEEAYQDGATYGRGTLYGVAQGATEVATEKMTGGMLDAVYGRGLLDGVTKSIARNTFGRAAMNMIEEGAEEAISEFVSPLEKAIYKGKVENFLTGEHWKEIGLSAAAGAVTSGIVGGATGQITNARTAAELTNDALTNIQKRSNLEANGKLTAKAEAKVTAEIKADMQAAEKYLSKMSEDKRAKFFEDNKGLSTIFTEDGKIRPEFARKTWGGQSAAETANGAQAQNAWLSEGQKRYVSVNARYDSERATNAVKALQERDNTAQIYSGELSSEQEETYAVAKRIVNNLNQATGDDIALIVVSGDMDFNALNVKSGNAILISEKTLANTHGAVDALAKILFEEATHSTQTTDTSGRYTNAWYGVLFHELAENNSATMEAITARLLADGNGYGFTQEMLEGLESKLDSRENLTEEEKKMLDRINEKTKKGEKLTEKEKELRDRVTLNAKEQELLDEIVAQTAGEVLGGNEEIIERYASNKTAAEKILGVFGKIKKALSRANSKEAKAERARVERVECMLLNALAAKGYTYRDGKVVSVRTPEEKEEGNERFNRSAPIDLSDDTELSQRIGDKTGSAKHKIIQQYVLESLPGEITLSDGIKATVDSRDALHISEHHSADKGVAEVSKIREIVETAKPYAYEDDVDHGKFSYFRYYQAFVKYKNDTFPVYVNVGLTRNNDGYKIYDLTEKIRDTAHLLKGVGRLPDGSITLGNGILDNSVPQNSENVNPKSEKSSEENSGVRFSKTDSLGNALTDAQQRYFENSKVRDENGNLMVVYHGSPSVFTKFSADYLGMHGSSEGQGFYFTDSKNMAEGYKKSGGQLLSGYLNIQNPLSAETVTLKRSEVRKLIRALDPTGDDLILNYDPRGGMGYPSAAWYDRSFNATLETVMSGNNSDSEILAELANAMGDHGKVLETVSDVLGYDGYIVSGKYEGSNVYVAFQSNQFKNMDNLSPTADADIRFSRGLNAKNDGESGDVLEGLTKGQRKKVVANNTMDRVFTRIEAQDEINRIVDEVIAKKYGDTVIKGGRQSLVNRYWIDLNKSNGFSRDAIANKIADYMIENAMVSQAVEEMSDDASATGEEIAKKAKRIRLDSIDSGELEKMRSQIANELLNSFDRLGSESTFSKNTRRKIKLSIWNSNIAKELQGFVDGKGEYVAADILNAPEMQEWIKTLKPLAGKAIYGKEARKVVEQLSKFYNEDNELLEGYLDENVEDAVKFILEKKDSKAMLSTEEMEALHKILAGIRRLYKTYDRVTLAGRSVSLTDTAMTAHEQISKARRKATTRSFAGKLKNLFSTEMVEPRVVIEALEGFTDDGILSKAYRDIQNGETRKQILYMQMMYDFDEFMDKNKKYGKRLYKDYIEFHGQKLSVGQAITLHELAKRDQAKLGLSENGFTFDDKKNVKHSIKAITDDELSTLSNQFTEQDKEFIKITEHFFNEVASEIKMEADKENIGYTNALEEFYFPIARDKMTIRKAITDTRSMLQNMISLYSYSFNKDVRKNAKNALYVGNVYDIIKTHAEQLSSYAGLYAPMKSFEQIYGKNIAKNKGLTGVISVRQTLNDNVWDGTDKYISKLMSDISGTTPTEKSEFVEYLRGAYAKFQLGANVKTFLSQIASYPQAFTELDMGSLVKGFATVSNHADMDKYCPYASVRNYNKGIVKAEGVIDKIGKVGDTMTKPIQVFDRFTIGKLWNACQYQVQKDSGLKIGTEENKVKAGAMLEDVIRKTQPDFNTSERSALMRSQSEYARAAVMFTSAQLKQLSRLVESVGKLQYAKTTGDAAKIKAARIQVARSSSAVLMSVTAYAMMGMLAKALFARLKASDKEPEEKFEAIAKEFGADMISGGVGLLPIVRDIYSAISSKAMNNGNGYEINSFYYDVLNNVVNAGYKAGELAVHAMQGKNIEDYQYMSVIRNTTNAVGQLTGVPTRNLYNEITGLIKRVSPSAGYTINSKFYNANYVSDMNKALESGDEQRANTIMNLMMSERMDGISTSQINKSVLDLYKKGYTVLPRTVGDSITYDGQEYKLTARQKARFQKVYGQASAAVQKVVSLQSYRKLSDDVKAKTIKRIYDMYYNLAIDDLLGTDTEDKTVLFSYAIDPDKLALIVAQAQSLQADTDKNGNAIAGSKKQKVVTYINGMKLTAAQKYMIMGYLGYRNAKGEEQVKAYINRLPGLSKAEKKTLMEYSGY